MRRALALMALCTIAACRPHGARSSGATTGSSGGATSGTSTGSSGTGGTGGSTGGTSGGTSTGSSASSGSSGSSETTGASCPADGASCDLPGSQVAICCGGACVDVMNDAAHCGGCTTCQSGESCYRGRCVVPACNGSGACVLDGGAVGDCCGTQCADLESDLHHCGLCATDCGSNAACHQAQCFTTDCATAGNTRASCQASDGGYGTCCGDTCVYVFASNDNCGGCGIACPAGTTCQQGGCATADGGYGWCSAGADGGCPTGHACVNGTKCVVSACGPQTEGDACALSSGGAGLCCNQACVDIMNDSANCYACGQACGAGNFCSGGRCTPVVACDLSNSGTGCPLDGGGAGGCCSGACVNPMNDPQNCGECGTGCPLGSQCQSRSCAYADGGYASCASDLDCPTGTTCGHGFCVRGCDPGESGRACPFGLSYLGSSTLGTCCGGACVDTKQDPNNCFQCGHTCSSGLCSLDMNTGQACFPADAGAGASCNGGWGCGSSTQTCINGACVQNTCDWHSSGSLCAMQSGGIGVCCGGWSQTCADIASDPANCGACNWACPSGASCVNGACSSAGPSCGPGHHDGFCDLDGGAAPVCCPSGCADLASDTSNCGACGQACSAGLSCIQGACLATTCTASLEGHGCAADGGSGTCCSAACTNLSTDPANCGTCGHGCASGASCVNGQCGLDACDPAHTGAPCHLGGGLGTCCSSSCVDTQNDPSNCSGCGLACPSGTSCVQSGCR